MIILRLLNLAQSCSQETASSGQNQSSNPLGTLISFLPFILIFVIFYFLLIYPESKKRKQHQKLLENLQKDDKVLTTGGFYGIVKNIKGNIVVLKIAEKTDVDVERGSIVKILNQTEEEKTS